VDEAIAALQAEVEALGFPPEGTKQWYLRQAKSLGLSMLRAAMVQRQTDPVSLDQFRKKLRVQLMETES